MAELMRSFDWSKSPLGPPEEWPESLKTSLRIILKSAYPMFIWWGKELIMFHNDAYLPVLGKKHPDALGKKAKAVWAEIWEDIEGFVTGVFNGRTMYARDLELYLERLGFPEETYWTFSYSPIINNEGEVEGLFCACNEETAKILQQRRFRALINLSNISTRNTDVKDLFNTATEIISGNANCIPFAAIYRVDTEKQFAYLHSYCGISDDQIIFDPIIPLNEKSILGWDFRHITNEQEFRHRKNLQTDFNAEFKKTGLEVDEAVITSISKAGEDEVAGLLVCALSPHIQFNNDYSDFIKSIASSISRAKADIRAHEIALEQAAVSEKAAKAKQEYLNKIELEKEKLKSIIMQAPIAMCFLKGADHIFEIANNGYLTLVGKKREEIMDKALLDAIPETKNQPIYKIIKDVFLKGKAFTGKEFPIELNRADKAKIGYYTFVYEPMRNFEGQVHGIMVVAMEVTDQVMARQAIERQEEYFRNMANKVPVMIWMTDTKGRCTYLNEQWLNYTGQALIEGVGTGWLKAVHRDDRTIAEKIFLRGLKEKEGFEITYRLKDFSGNYYWHIDSGLPRYNENGVFEGFTGAVINIHERKMAEDALRKRENELSSAISATNLGTWVYYPQTGKVNWSTRSKELFGLPPEAFVDYEIFESGLHKDDLPRVREALSRSINPDVKDIYDLEYRTIGLTDGKLRWLRATGQPYFNDDNVVDLFIGTLLDITDQKALEKQKDDFLAISSHELKTPVTSIKGYVQMLTEDFEEKQDQDTVNQLNIVNRQVDKLIILINDLLDTSKLETGQMQLNMELFDFDSLVNEVVSSMQHISTNHNLQISGSTNKEMFGDQNRIEQVLTNLISNAIKFSPEAHEVHLKLYCEQNCICLTVEDFGVGMEPNTANKIFDRFYRDPETSHWSTGLGLGLFISFEIVKRHNGILSVRSKYGKGTIFSVKLPYSNHPSNEKVHSSLRR